jgi:hypothetical protein
MAKEKNERKEKTKGLIIMIAVCLMFSVTIVPIFFIDEPPTSCERCQENWTEQCSGKCVCEDAIRLSYLCTSAREKTVSDLSCAQLFDYYENEKYSDKYPDTTEGQLLYQMIRKDCKG